MHQWILTAVITKEVIFLIPGVRIPMAHGIVFTKDSVLVQLSNPPYLPILKGIPFGIQIGNTFGARNYMSRIYSFRDQDMVFVTHIITKISNKPPSDYN